MKIEIKSLPRQSFGDFLNQHGLSLRFIEEDLGKRWAASLAPIPTVRGLMFPIRDSTNVSLVAVGATIFEALNRLAEQLSNHQLSFPIKAFAKNPDLDLTSAENWYRVKTPVFEIKHDILGPLNKLLLMQKSSQVMDGPPT